MKRVIATAVLAALIASTALLTGATASAAEGHVLARLHPVDDSGVQGFVSLVQLPRGRGTHITVVAFGLKPGNHYLSLYYDNHTCALEPYSADDVIGTYTGNAAGVGTTHATVEDDLDEINSVSVRSADDFRLLACADVHPHG
jgi:hypothetical protein